ncbi:MAG: hypothetical protein JO362_08815, partial [Streptomycetaceae bacterium]|nr:hypothetical protein [Streptomycetaceae bacterium]
FARSRPGPESGTKTEAGPGQHVGQQPGKRFEEQPGEQPGAGPVAGPHALVLPAQQARLVADVPLPGRELAGLRLRVVETGEGPEAVRRLELLDFGDPAHPLRWTVHERHDGDGGFRIIDEHGDRRWYLTPDYEMEFREVRLTRTPRFVRFSADGSSASIVSPLGGAVTDEYVLEPVIDGSTGREIGLRVQLAEGAGPQPGAPVAWCMDDEGLSQVSEVHREISTSVRLMRREQSAPPAQTHTIDPRRQPAATGRLEVFEADGKPARDQPVAALGADSGAGQMAGPTDPRRVLDLLQSVTTERLDESGDTEAFEDARDSL